MDIVIRKMVFDDLRQVQILSDQLGYPSNLEEIQSRYKTITQDPNSALFVADYSSQIVGFIYLGVIQPLTSERRAQIWGLVVDKENRKLGVGKKLVVHGEAWAKSDNLNIVEVGTNQQRLESHVFYKKLGYTKKKEWTIYKKEI